MNFQILLEDRMNGRKVLIKCTANMLLEELSVKIKVELRLPLCDRGWHRFLYRGKVYVPEEHVVAEPEIYWEYYSISDIVRLKQLYTVLGSAIVYLQDAQFVDEYKVRCTLVGRN